MLHVLPLDLDRGAQKVARSLVAVLHENPDVHRVLTLYRPEASVLDADYSLGLPKSGARRLGFDPRVVLSLRRALRCLQPDLLVAHGSEPLKYLVAARVDLPLIYYKIGVTHLEDPARLRRFLHRRLLNRADSIVAISDACYNEATERFGVPAAKLQVIPNARDPHEFSPGPAAVGRQTVRLLFVGHLASTKRPELFVELASRLRERGLRIEARMVGDGPLRPKLDRPAATAGVTLLGSRTDVPELMRWADVFVFTSSPSGEGMPGVLIEAGMSGLPVVTTDVPGARDVVADGETGFVVPVDDRAQAESALTHLVENPHLRQRMGQAARDRCEADFSWGSVVADWRLAIDAQLRRA